MSRLGGGVALVLLLAALAAPSAHAASPATSIVIYGGLGQWLIEGHQFLLLPPEAEISVSGTAADMTFTAVRAGQSPERFSLRFAAPPGRTLAKGDHYVRAKAPATRGQGEPGLAITFDDEGCAATAGAFEIRDLLVGADGRVQRAWITYEEGCEGHRRIGEVRYGMPAPTTDVVVAPAAIRWPANDAMRKGHELPVWAIGRRPVQMRQYEMANPEQFWGGWDCAWGDGALPVGAVCRGTAAFRRDTNGTHRGGLWGIDSNGVRHGIELSGFGYGGTTRLVMRSQSPDEYVGEGRDYDYTSWDRQFGGALSRWEGGIELWADEYDASTWNGRVRPVYPDPLIVGRTYTDARDYSFPDEGHPGMSVSGNGSACGSVLRGEFTVHDLTKDDIGKLRSASFSFVQRCGDTAPSLSGRWDFRVGDYTPLAPWMIPDPALQGPDAVVPRPEEPPGSDEPQEPTQPEAPQEPTQVHEDAASPPGDGALPPPPPAATADSVTPAGTPTAQGWRPLTLPRLSAPRTVRRRTLARSGLVLRLHGLQEGLLVGATLRHRGRTLARSGPPTRRRGAIELRLRPSARALRRVRRSRATLSLTLRVGYPAQAPATITRAVRVR